MALIACPDCKKKFSDTASTCPHCGYVLTPQKLAELRKVEEQTKKIAGIGCATILALMFVNYVFNSCSSNDGGNRTPRPAADDKIAAWVMAQDFVKERLKSPSSADFGGVFGDYQDPNDIVIDLGSGRYRIRAWVDAQNSFGAQIRQHFVCELERVGSDRWRLKHLSFQE